MKRAVIAAALVITLVSTLAAAACSDDDNSDSTDRTPSASQASLDELSARLQRDEMLSYTIAIRQAALHAVDEGLNEAGTIESSYIPNTRLAIRLLALTPWPADFQAEADEVRSVAVELLKALESGDVAAAASLATGLHEGEHEFNERVTNEVVKDLPPDAGGPEEEHEESTTPEAGGAPEAEATP